MSTNDGPPSLTEKQLDNIQGDIWSKGFPKYYETYYFFAIKPGNAKFFAQSLKDLVTQSPPLISTLRSVKKDRARIQEWKDQAGAQAKTLGTQAKYDSLLPISNALIAFTRKGLDAISTATKTGLDLDLLTITDPAFSEGMASPDTGKRLNDPVSAKWDPLFRSPTIHGMLKIAGNSKQDVEVRLSAIKKVLKYGTAIEDAFHNPSPIETGSRVDGWTRPNDRGKEHFGFEDGISQPLMGGIDELDRGDPANMNTDPSLIIVTPDTHNESDDSTRPVWMNDGSFVVFRKLEQNVKGFEALTDQWQKFQCAGKAHMGAKLMGRWQSGAPIVKFPVADTTNPNKDKLINDFVYKDQICPMSAHIRKTNIREIIDSNDGDPRASRTRIIRSGISYGPDYKEHENDGSTRGLLFTCYQGNIEDAFENMQAAWSNNISFRSGTPGHDPIIGQTWNRKLNTQITDKTGQITEDVHFEQVVTLKGGEYFFAPSINALRQDLSNISS